MRKLLLLILTLLPLLVSAQAAMKTHCTPPNIDISLKHFNYCIAPEQTSKLSFHTFSDNSYSMVISNKESELFLNWLPSSIALADLPKKYGLAPITFLEQLFNGKIQEQKPHGHKISAVFGDIDTSELFVEKVKGSYIFSALNKSGQNTAFLLLENSDWLLQIDGKFNKRTLIQIIDRTRLVGSL
ncbi:hypothetical protein CBQ28_18045 [Pseudoalteromonas sp. GCY]|uniref:hypothetical protein n=1 Tax=Pseudoalteromonas sp. GCY TaxID=2003316 RepID=UPI000BFEDA8D|nr:hypothetical protein [Pseudoalteromonas sp. GCY]PHI35668.1 hypothetical protein CBQ28_18045 [Pseudoalteromonas sp. GCY]QQQ67952.1 hypothetical protein JJQ94_09120 [Pseudoalteromonas sp. GCY]